MADLQEARREVTDRSAFCAWLERPDGKWEPGCRVTAVGNPPLHAGLDDCPRCGKPAIEVPWGSAPPETLDGDSWFLAAVFVGCLLWIVGATLYFNGWNGQ